MNDPTPTHTDAQPTEPPKVWSWMSVLLYWLNLLGIVLIPVVVVAFNDWLIKPRLAQANVDLPGPLAWFYALTFLRAAVPFATLAVVLTACHWLIRDKRVTSILNLLVAVGVGVVLLGWVAAVLWSVVLMFG